MTTISRVRTILDGFPGGPGISTMYSLDGPSLLNKLTAFWAALVPIMPDVFTAKPQEFGDLLDAGTGTLTGIWTSAPVAAASSTVLDRYSAASGALVTWNTGVVADGHHLKGKTFIVPIIAGQYATDGGLLPGCVSLIQAAATTLVTAASPDFGVWHRPFAGKPAVGTPGLAGYRPARPAHAGSFGIITSASVSSKAVILRSRRD